MIAGHLSFSEYLQEFFPFKVQKLIVDAGASCPNRDGTLGTGGCAFCNNDSFRPAYAAGLSSISQQIEAGKRFFAHKAARRGQVSPLDVRYLAYFQAYTNTYGPTDVLLHRFREALSAPGVVGIVIGTRPDCLEPDLLVALSHIARQSFVMIEFGVESVADTTLQAIGRGHSFQCAASAIRRTAEAGIQVGAHIIFGFPGESHQHILHTADVLSSLPINVLKIHQLQIVRGSRYEAIWRSSPHIFPQLTAHDYAALVAAFCLRLSPSIALERFVSECPPSLLISPRWGLKSSQVQDLVVQHIKQLAGSAL